MLRSLCAIILVPLSLLLAGGPQASSRCADYYVKRCACPSGCAQDYCDKLCRLAVDRYPRCGYICPSGCACEAHGMLAFRWFDALPGLFASASEAAEPSAATRTVRPLEPGVEEVLTPFGEFVVTDERARLPDADRSAGIGVRLILQEGGLRIMDVRPGSPAKKAGLRPDDVIVGIRQESGKMESAKDMPVEEAIALLRGQAGTRVAVEVSRKGRKPFSASLVRSAEPFRRAVTAGSDNIQEVPLGASADRCPESHGDCLLLMQTGQRCHYACPPSR